MYNMTRDFYEDEYFDIRLTYHPDPAGGVLVFAHNEWYKRPNRESLTNVRKQLKKLMKKLKKEGHTALFANTVNYKFLDMVKVPYDRIPVDSEYEGLIAWSLLH